MDERIKRIRQKANLNSGIFTRIPDDLILLAFITSSSVIPLDLRNQLREKYGYDDHRAFVWLGFAVLKMIVTRFLFRLRGSYRRLNLYTLARFREEIIKNNTLDCLMTRKNLCNEIITDQYQIICADSLKALIGVVFFYLYYELREANTLNIISDWFQKNWLLQEIFNNLYRTGKTRCKVRLPPMTPVIPEVIPPITPEIIPPITPEIIPPITPEIIPSPRPLSALAPEFIPRVRFILPPTRSCNVEFNYRHRNVKLPPGFNRDKFLRYITSNKMSYSAKLQPEVYDGKYLGVIYLGNKSFVCAYGSTLDEVGQNLLNEAVKELGL